jgi:hypothetical protein
VSTLTSKLQFVQYRKQATMNFKNNWNTVAIDESCSSQEIKDD